MGEFGAARMRKPDAAWIAGATDEEMAEVHELDARIDQLETERRELSRLRYTITNRCAERTRRARALEESQ